MKMTTKALFGGALFAAGIAGAAEAQWNVDEAFSFTLVTGSDGSTTGLNYGSGTSYLAFPGPNLLGSGSATVSDTMVSSEIDIDLGPNTPYEYAFARARAYVTVDAPVTVYATWDFTDVPAGGLTFANIFVYDLTNASYLFNYGTFTSGSNVAINLLPGVDYLMQVNADSDAPSQMFGQIVIPAPGGLAILGAGVLGVRRRRRRT